MESIDRLRRYVECHDKITGLTATCINHLIDSIDKEVDDMWHALTIDAKPMTDENMAESGWVRLPLDADGVPIHVGDVMEFTYDPPQDQPTFEVSGFGAAGTLFYAARGEIVPRKTTNASVVRHRRSQTVEDVLREFVERLDEIGSEDDCGGVDEQECRACIRRDIASAYAEYAAKLRLAGDE